MPRNLIDTDYMKERINQAIEEAKEALEALKKK